MKYLNLSLLLVSGLALGLPGASADDTAGAVVPERRIELFNGKDFAGFTFFMKDNADPKGTWSVRDGVIHCSGRPTGYLRTEQSYADYRLSVEWRFVKVAPNADNTGVLVHMQLPDKLWPPCVQCQGRSGKQGDLFLMGGAESKEHRGMDANTPLPKRGPANEKPVGDWNTCEVVCERDVVRTFINGKLMNETTQCSVANGFIGLQCEGAEFEVRKIALEPLPGN